MNQTVTNDHMVFIHYVLKDDEGIEVDRSHGGDPLGYIHGRGQIISGLEKALNGKEAGATVKVQITPDDGYGEHDPNHVMTVTRDHFDFTPEIGNVVRAEAEGAPSHPFMIIDVDDDEVTLDGNHPLAGKTLDFEVTIVDVRPATEEELQDAEDAMN